MRHWQGERAPIRGSEYILFKILQREPWNPEARQLSQFSLGWVMTKLPSR